jgi:MFS family permease
VVVEAERPATFREIFRVAEFRGLYAAYLLSLLGDMLAKVAVTFLVFRETGSPLLSAATFGLSYLPWGIGGPFLAALADRWSRRRVLIACDVARAALVALLAIPDMPWPAMLLVLLVASLLTPPFEAARSALMPDVLRGDRFVVATSVLVVSTYIAGVVGFVAGGTLVQFISARGALLVNSATFAVSALLIWVYVTPRPPGPPPPRPSLIRETADGLRLVFGHRVLRSYLLLVWAVSALVSASEGLAAAYAAHLGEGPAAVGLLLAGLPFGMAFGGLVLTRAVPPVRRIRLAIPLATLSTTALLPLLLAGLPFGMAFGGLVLTRAVPPVRRIRLAIPLATLSTTALLPLLLDPPLPVVLALYVVSGIGLAAAIPLNAMFVRAVAPPYRGRAFGVARSGLEVAQGLAIVVAGAVASVLPVPVVIALFGGVVGTVLVAVIAMRWPSIEEQLAAEDTPVGAPPA